MSPRRSGQTAPCDRADAGVRLRHAGSFLLVADLKDDAQYGVLVVSPERARSAVGWARRLVAAAREVAATSG